MISVSHANNSQSSSPIEALNLIFVSKSLPVDSTIESHLCVEAKEKLAALQPHPHCAFLVPASRNYKHLLDRLPSGPVVFKTFKSKENFLSTTLNRHSFIEWTIPQNVFASFCSRDEHQLDYDR